MKKKSGQLCKSTRQDCASSVVQERSITACSPFGSARVLFLRRQTDPRCRVLFRARKRKFCGKRIQVSRRPPLFLKPSPIPMLAVSTISVFIPGCSRPIRRFIMPARIKWNVSATFSSCGAKIRSRQMKLKPEISGRWPSWRQLQRGIL